MSIASPLKASFTSRFARPTTETERRRRVGGVDQEQPVAAVIDVLGGRPGRHFDFPLGSLPAHWSSSAPRRRPAERSRLTESPVGCTFSVVARSPNRKTCDNPSSPFNSRAHSL